MRKPLLLAAIILTTIIIFITAVNHEGQKLKVISETGATQYLNPAERPVLFFAPWCHRCDEVLVEITKLPAENQPILVGALLRNENEMQSSLDKAKSFGLGDDIYFTDHDPGTLPALLVKDNQYIKDPEAINTYLQGGSIDW